MSENNPEKPYMLTGYISNVPDTYENIQNDYNSGNISADEMIQRSRDVDYAIKQQADRALQEQYFKNTVAGLGAIGSIPLGPVAGGALSSGTMSYAREDNLPNIAANTALGAIGGKTADMALKPLFNIGSQAVNRLYNYSKPYISNFMDRLNYGRVLPRFGKDITRNQGSPITYDYKSNSMGGDAIRGGNYAIGTLEDFLKLGEKERALIAEEAVKNNRMQRLSAIAKLESELANRPLQQVRDELARSIKRNSGSVDLYSAGYYTPYLSRELYPTPVLEFLGDVPSKEIHIAPYSNQVFSDLGISPYDTAVHEATHRFLDRMKVRAEVDSPNYDRIYPILDKLNSRYPNGWFSMIDGNETLANAMARGANPRILENPEYVGAYGTELAKFENIPEEQIQLYNQYLDDAEVFKKIYDTYRKNSFIKGTNKW